MDPKEQDATELYFPFLNRLRESGVTNMFGAAPYLEETFDLSKSDAKNVLISWMKWANSDPKNLEK